MTDVSWRSSWDRHVVSRTAARPNDRPLHGVMSTMLLTHYQLFQQGTLRYSSFGARRHRAYSGRLLRPPKNRQGRAWEDLMGHVDKKTDRQLHLQNQEHLALAARIGEDLAFAICEFARAITVSHHLRAF